MQGRQERILIPSAIAPFSMMITLWASAGLINSPFAWFLFIRQADGKEISALLGLLAAVGVTNLGIGYICQAIVTPLMFFCPRIRFINDLEYLFRAFGITNLDNISTKLASLGCHTSTKKIRRILRDLLLAEFHIRLHSHAPQQLIDHCSRRNSAWYIALDSAAAFMLGFLFASLVILSNAGNPTFSFVVMCTAQSIGFGTTFLFFVLVFPFVLYKQGQR